MISLTESKISEENPFLPMIFSYSMAALFLLSILASLVLLSPSWYFELIILFSFLGLIFFFAGFSYHLDIKQKFGLAKTIRSIILWTALSLLFLFILSISIPR